ncbi:DNA repair protein [Enterococcus mundtii]|nr:DNA repair protein [Enterococcus mundtii]MZZ60863.1 DNA repair protein [Enterococcus mundtii]MZZ67848.1 DNA repair protein [Enterococcus mundtii]MZZ96699.1 DNA repair protein [Enterococcus mundtii]MZZ99673.1 DNA repair protein [Enterococcus mundtii]
MGEKLAITSKVYLSLSSGNVLPSKQDMRLTRRIQECGEMMGIEVLDHLIIGSKQYFSLREEGLMEKE